MDGLILLLFQLVLGLASGLVMSLVGASAVMVIVPGLNIVLNYRIHTAIGISLLVDVLASLAVGYAYWRHGNVDLRQGLWIALGSVADALLDCGDAPVHLREAGVQALDGFELALGGRHASRGARAGGGDRDASDRRQRVAPEEAQETAKEEVTFREREPGDVRDPRSPRERNG